MKLAILCFIFVVFAQVILFGSAIVASELSVNARQQVLHHANLPLKRKTKGFKTRKVPIKKKKTKKSRKTTPTIN